jgi:predicted NBD/HSP70 family sugar kinase
MENPQLSLSSKVVLRSSVKFVVMGAVSSFAFFAWKKFRRPMLRQNKFFVGIDLGATNAKAGVVSQDGTLLGSANSPLSSLEPDAVVKSLVAVVHEAIANSGLEFKDIVAVGVGSPGHIFSGRVLAASNFPVISHSA